jgi:hypothetical protein
LPTIAQLLSRRSDLSTFVVHLTRDTPDSQARDSLASILGSRRLLARTPFGPAVRSLQAKLPDCVGSQDVVCFTETPLEHINLLLEPITDLTRSCEFEPYGIAVTKRVARDTAVNPVWYTDISPKGHDWLMNSVNALIDDAVDQVIARRAAGDANAHFKDYPVSRLTPFIEQMGVARTHTASYHKEFWWEREWRHRGDYLLPAWFIILVPESDHSAWVPWVKNTLGVQYPVLDPRWGLEEIIGRLAGFSQSQIRPF